MTEEIEKGKGRGREREKEREKEKLIEGGNRMEKGPEGGEREGKGGRRGREKKKKGKKKIPLGATSDATWSLGGGARMSRGTTSPAH